MNPFDPDYKPVMPELTPAERGRRTAAKKLAERTREACKIKIRRDAPPTIEQQRGNRVKTAKILKAGAL